MKYCIITLLSSRSEEAEALMSGLISGLIIFIVIKIVYAIKNRKTREKKEKFIDFNTYKRDKEYREMQKNIKRDYQDAQKRFSQFQYSPSVEMPKKEYVNKSADLLKTTSEVEAEIINAIQEHIIGYIKNNSIDLTIEGAYTSVQPVIESLKQSDDLFNRSDLNRESYEHFIDEITEKIISVYF